MQFDVIVPAMPHCDHDRRLLLFGLSSVPFATLLRAAPAVAQSGVGTTLPSIVQPAEKTKAAFLARAQALRDHAVTKAIKRMALSLSGTA